MLYRQVQHLFLFLLGSGRLSLFLAEQSIRKICHLRPQEKCRGESQSGAEVYFTAKGFRVIEQNEVEGPVLGVGEIAGTEFRRKEDRRVFPPEEGLERLAAERDPFAGAGGKGEVHPKPLNVQRQTVCLSPVLDGLLQSLIQCSAGESCTDHPESVGNEIHIKIRKIQRSSVSGKQLFQPLNECDPVLLRWFFEVQQDSLIVPPAALSKDAPAEMFRIFNGRDAAVADAQQSAP